MTSPTPPPLKTHQKPYIKAFEDWCAKWGIERITPTVACAFIDDHLPGKPLPLRRQFIASLVEVYGDVFRTRPFPYPLLKRYLTEDFETCVEKVRKLPQTQRAWSWLVLVCGCSWPAEHWTLTPSGRGYIVRIGGGDEVRVVPVTAEVGADLATVVGKKPPAKNPINVKDAHNALFEYLLRHDVPEVTRASIYGRWSAMRLERAERVLGLFGGRIRG